MRYWSHRAQITTFFLIFACTPQKRNFIVLQVARTLANQNARDWSLKMESVRRARTKVTDWHTAAQRPVVFACPETGSRTLRRYNV